MFATQNRNKGQWTSLEELPLQPKHSVKVWIKDLASRWFFVNSSLQTKTILKIKYTI
jgi:hypothetical protein